MNLRATCSSGFTSKLLTLSCMKWLIFDVVDSLRILGWLTWFDLSVSPAIRLYKNKSLGCESLRQHSFTCYCETQKQLLFLTCIMICFIFRTHIRHVKTVSFLGTARLDPFNVSRSFDDERISWDGAKVWQNNGLQTISSGMLIQ